VRWSELQNAYQGKTVVLTGHTGFKGTWLTLVLSELGATVHGLSLDGEDGGLFHQAGIDERCQSHIFDIRNAQKVSALMSSLKPDFVFHFAAQSLVGHGRKAPVKTFSTNVMGTVNLLEASQAVKAIVVASSDKCYFPSKHPRHELSRLGGLDPYSASKAALEHVVEAYREQYFDGARIATGRAGNVIGGGDWGEQRLIPDIIRSIVSDETLLLRHPRSCRAWQYILEPLWGYLMLGALLASDTPEMAKAWNFGPSQVASVSAVVHAVGQAWSKMPRVRFMSSSPAETVMLKLDTTQTERELRWSTKLSWEEAVNWSVRDYQSFHSGLGAASEHMATQISSYAQLWE
jgi:CDP-glucose 4,6-dehydratase